jgi:ABC-type polysaccharide/polyol phosphate transport system ATPase subunit
MNDIAIKIENLSKKYYLSNGINGLIKTKEEFWALKDVSLEIKKGEKIVITGPNGSGKSTLLKILAGIIKPTDGEVKIYGRVASILDIGAGFHPELSGSDNIFLNGQLLGFSKSEIKQKYNKIVEFSGIEKFINEPIKHYSNGMYLRLAFSIIAHLDFDVFLFDEIINVGDAEFREKSRKLFDNDKEKTIVLATHVLEEINSPLNRVVKLENGFLLEEKNSNNFEIKSEDDLLDGIIKFDQGMIEVDRIDFNDRIEFKITATLNDPHLKELHLAICLVDVIGCYLMCYLGHKHSDEIFYIDDYSFFQKFILNKNLFKAGSYSINFSYTKKDLISKYNKIPSSYYFNFEDSEYNLDFSELSIYNYGYINYLNTIKLF